MIGAKHEAYRCRIGSQGERDPFGKVRILARFPGSDLLLFAT
jgi:hypothetical protein